MDISDVRVKLVQDPGERLRAVCTVTFDDTFVVRDVKIVQGTNGLFVAMPSQKLSVHCGQCKQKNHLRAKYCNECGARLPENSAPSDSNGRARLHRDIAHPIKASFRQVLQEKVIQAFDDEVGRAEAPDYEPADYDQETDAGGETDDSRDTGDSGSGYDDIIAELRGRPAKPAAEPQSRPPEAEPEQRPRERRRHRRRDRPTGVAAEAPARERPEPQRDQGFGAAILESDEPAESEPARPAETRETRTERPTGAAEPAPRPAKPAEKQETDSAFGQGIL